MSIGDEEPVDRNAWLAGCRLNILHLGGLSHFPTYRSLEFLLEKVFPALHPDTLRPDTLKCSRSLTDEPHVKRIAALGARYPQVHFAGFVRRCSEDLCRGRCSRHRVDRGYRLATRIIESFAFGAPVISTTVGARGPERDFVRAKIFLVADNAESYQSSSKVF